MNKSKVLDVYASGKLRLAVEGKPYNEELQLLEDIIVENKWKEEANGLYLLKVQDYSSKILKPLLKRVREELIPFLTDYKIWNKFKNNTELRKLIEEVKEKDLFYSIREEIFNTLIEDSKFKDLSNSQKLKLAMKIGSCDTADLF